MLLSVPKKWKALFSGIQLPTHHHDSTPTKLLKYGYYPNTILLYEDNNKMTMLKLQDFTDEFIAQLRLKYDKNYQKENTDG